MRRSHFDVVKGVLNLGPPSLQCALRYWLGGVGVGSVLSSLLGVLCVLVIVVVPTPKFTVFDGVFSSVDSMVFVMNLAGPRRSFTPLVDAVFVSSDDGSTHGDGESGALRADVQRL